MAGDSSYLPSCPFFLADSRSLFLPVTKANKDVKDGRLEGRPWKREVNRFLSKIQTLSPELLTKWRQKLEALNVG